MPGRHLGVLSTDEVGQLHDGDDVVALGTQLLGEPAWVHLVEQQPHRLGPARISCWRRQAASSSSVVRSLAAIRASISSRWSA